MLSSTIPIIFSLIFSVGFTHAFDCNIRLSISGTIASIDCATALGTGNYVGCVTTVSSNGNIYLCAESSQLHMCGCTFTDNGDQFTNYCCNTTNCNTPNTLTWSAPTNFCPTATTTSVIQATSSGSQMTTKLSLEIFFILSTFFLLLQ